jgi:hypothetical protein
VLAKLTAGSLAANTSTTPRLVRAIHTATFFLKSPLTVVPWVCLASPRTTHLFAPGSIPGTLSPSKAVYLGNATERITGSKPGPVECFASNKLGGRER